MIVFDPDRPARREAVFKTGADGAAPARFAALIERDASGRDEAGVLVGGDGAAALHVPKHIVPGVADLAREQAETVDAGLVGDAGKKQAEILAFQTGPIALRFDAEHHGSALPAVTDLTAGHAAGVVIAAFGCARDGRATEHAGVGPAFVAPAAAAVETDVEAAPVVHRRHHHPRRLAVGASGEIRGRRRRSNAQRSETNQTQQNLLHRILQLFRSFFASGFRPKRFKNTDATAQAVHVPPSNIPDSSPKAVSEMQHSRTK